MNTVFCLESFTLSTLITTLMRGTRNISVSDLPGSLFNNNWETHRYNYNDYPPFGIKLEALALHLYIATLSSWFFMQLIAAYTTWYVYMKCLPFLRLPYMNYGRFVHTSAQYCYTFSQLDQVTRR